MKFDPIKNPNYVATIIRVPELQEVPGLDNLRALRTLGMQALVGKDTPVGTLGVLFSTEVQLSLPFAAANNLHRHTNLNVDQTKAGYLEDSRRVKAIKLRGVRSDSLFLPMESLAAVGLDPAAFKEGDVFDSVDGLEICRKYVVREPGGPSTQAARVRRVDLKAFPMHIDTENWWRNEWKIPEDAPVWVTQKLHGTSVRYGNILIDDAPVGRLKRLLRRLAGVPETSQSYHFVVGSRTVVKSIDLTTEDGKQHYYGGSDIWTSYADEHRLADLIPQGYLVYGELVGFTPAGQPIQPGYTYEQAAGAKLYVYRVAVSTPNGKVVDLSWPEVRQFCLDRGLAHVPTFQLGQKKDLQVDNLMDVRYYDLWVGDESELSTTERPVALSSPDTVDEGVCIRYDGPEGVVILKAKSPEFLGYESRALDSGAADVESEEA